MITLSKCIRIRITQTPLLQMDRKYGNSWHVVVGEGFGFEVSYEVSTLLYMFFAGNLAVCVWKCS